MLDALGDPATRVIRNPKLTSKGGSAGLPNKGERQPSYSLNADGVLIVTINNYADLTDSNRGDNRSS